jgi:redox-sensitive bicupin YhaK (pirin superfamily)
MIEVIPFETLGRLDIDWLSARYHFSFANYYDPARSGLGPLLVWNDDTIQPGTGFDPHGHRDMEIITYVRRGAVSHRDHLGNQGRTETGDVQVISAGTGIRHAEYNLEDEITQIFQIWIEPKDTGLAPRWATRRFPKAERTGELIVLVSGRGDDEGALPIHQDAAILGARLAPGQGLNHRLAKSRRAYLVPASGRIEINGTPAKARDGIMVTDAMDLAITAQEDAEILVADLP